MIPAMTSPPPEGNGTRDVDIRGRMITVKELTDAQMLLMAREARLAQQPDTESDRRLTSIARIFDILESVVINDEDREYLMDITVKGQLTLGDMLTFASPEAETEAEKPKVRRGRAPTKRA